MKSYIVDTESFEVEAQYDNINRARYDMSDHYGWYPNNRYRLFYDDNEVYEYWQSVMIERPEMYEGLGISENQLFDMFSDWLNDATTDNYLKYA